MSISKLKRPQPHTQVRRTTLNVRSLRDPAGLTPETVREWRLYRLGVLEGARRAREGAAQLEQRVLFNGVELDFPAAPAEQVKRRRAG